jgi:hypothetical protein
MTIGTFLVIVQAFEFVGEVEIADFRISYTPKIEHYRS